jgi:hypothetical protein
MNYYVFCAAIYSGCVPRDQLLLEPRIMSLSLGRDSELHDYRMPRIPLFSIDLDSNN